MSSEETCTWLCEVCERRMPLRKSVCRCGAIVQTGVPSSPPGALAVLEASRGEWLDVQDIRDTLKGVPKKAINRELYTLLGQGTISRLQPDPNGKPVWSVQDH